MSSRTLDRLVRLAAAIGLLLFAVSAAARAQVLSVAELNTEQLRGLDKAKTVVFLPVGILEEHGPYLPAYADGFNSRRATRDVAEAVAGRGWTALVFPEIPLGVGGVNEVAAKYPFPGTYVVRAYTLRSIVMDLADELGEHGFRWVFIVNSHGAPNHNRVLDQASRYFVDTYGGQMLQLRGFGDAASGPNPADTLTQQARDEDNGSGHAGISETSAMLFLHPGLVAPGYKTAPNFTSTDMIATASRADWAGYFGAPKYASAQYGALQQAASSARRIQHAFAVLDGKASAPRPQAGPSRAADEASLSRDAKIEARQQAWLKANGLR